MNIAGVISELRAERRRIDSAITALEGLSSNGATRAAVHSQITTHGQKRGRLTPQGRKRLSEMMKKRWAERRKKISAKE